MRSTVFFIVSCLLIAMLAFGTSCSEPRRNSDAYLVQLDSLLRHQPELDQVKQMRIGELKRKRATATTLTDLYMINSLLLDEYSTYNADSALKYANANLEIAEKTGTHDWLVATQLKKAGLLAATGLLGNAEETMKEINRSGLKAYQLADYYEMMIYLYSHLGNYAGPAGTDFYVMERAYKDSIMAVITPQHPEYLWNMGWAALGTDRMDDDLIDTITNKVETSSLCSQTDSKNAYVLAKLYQQKGDYDNYVKYMILSSISDVKMVNADVSSLEDLAKIMFDRGDIERAYTYIDYCLNKAISFPNRVKAYGVTNTLDRINKAYQERGHKQQRRTMFFLALACILAAILLASIAIIIVQNGRLRRQGQNLDAANKSLKDNVAKLSSAQQQLNEANGQLQQLNADLKQLNADLKQKNDELYESNYVKEEYIGYIFTICSNYIGKLEELKKNIHLKVVTKKYKEIEASTANFDMKDELKEFYQSFDSVFLHIYPNFVNDFNSLLQEDKRISLREGELLNTELRIYALVRLGITDSVKIAEFLHCSPQTVYNNRFRVRSKALLPKKDFVESVRTLGAFMDRGA